MLGAVVFLGWARTEGQDKTAKPGIAAVAWLEGNWNTAKDNGTLQELWSAPSGDSMMGAFRWSRDGKVWLFEMLSIVEESDGVVFRFRHFGRDLSAWEEKNDPLTLKLIQSSADELVFENGEGERPKRMTYKRIDADTLGVRLESMENGKPSTLEFEFKRKK